MQYLAEPTAATLEGFIWIYITTETSGTPKNQHFSENVCFEAHVALLL
jgi:hypothetical protein